MLGVILLMLLIVLVCAVIANVSKQNKKSKLELDRARKMASRPPDPPAAELKKISDDQDFDERWDVLRKYDDQVREAVEKVATLGPQGVQELKQAFRVIGDKDKLAEIADRIVASSGSEPDGEISEKISGSTKTEEIIEEVGSNGKRVYVWNGKRYFSRDAAMEARRQARES